MNGALAGIDMERFVFGIAQCAFCMLVVVEGQGNRAMVTAEQVVVAAGSSLVKRFLAPLCMCVAQYFWPGRTALLHCHFLPSVLRHLPYAGSMLVLSLRYEGLQTETEMAGKK